jgi:hypothetical protein
MPGKRKLSNFAAGGEQIRATVAGNVQETVRSSKEASGWVR